MSLPFDSRETETQRGRVTCLKCAQEGGVPGPQVPDSQAEEPASAPTLALSGTLALPPALGLGQPSRRRSGGTPRPPREIEACSRLRPPPAHLPLSGQPAEPRLRGLS